MIAAEDRADGVAGLVRESDQIPQRRTARSPWHASTAAIRSLPEDVRATLEDVDVDVRSMSLIEAITDLDAAIDARIAARLLI